MNETTVTIALTIDALVLLIEDFFLHHNNIYILQSFMLLIAYPRSNLPVVIPYAVDKSSWD